MCGTCKILNFSWLLFAALMIGQNLLTLINTLSKWSLNIFYRVNGLSVGLCILCVKMRTFLCGESTLPHNKRNCFPPYPDHYLTMMLSSQDIVGLIDLIDSMLKVYDLKNRHYPV